ncbi:hypothetical protein AB0C77_12815 [Streptomyces sp. NPDC048629]|uniref:hypothetical protein n=1 Tax=Streptomyces sp. NPDC048629 TaxID=3154824 RepID=UPI00341302FA
MSARPLVYLACTFLLLAGVMYLLPRLTGGRFDTSLVSKFLILAATLTAGMAAMTFIP